MCQLAPQQLEHLIGALDVTHRPVQVRDPGDTPAGQLDLGHAGWIKRAENPVGFGGIALPQQRSSQQLHWRQVHRRD